MRAADTFRSEALPLLRQSLAMKILVPVDGSSASTQAVRLAVEQAKVFAGSAILILNVQNPAILGLNEGAAIMSPTWIEQQEASAAGEATRLAVAMCREAGIPYVVRSERGAIAATVDRVTREEHVDHVIMGTRGLGGVRGLLLGSVATQVLHLVEVPVTLVK